MKRRVFLVTLGLAALLTLLPSLVANGQTVFQANLFGQEQVPPVGTNDYGTCTGILDKDEFVLSLSCEHTVDNPTASHLHEGFSGENGPVVFDLGEPTSPIQGEWEMELSEAVRLFSGGFYVNVHTPAHPSGHVRGQLKPSQSLTNRAFSVHLTRDRPSRTDYIIPSGVCYISADVEEQPGGAVHLDIRCGHNIDDVAYALLAIGGEEYKPGTMTVDLGSRGSLPIRTEISVTDPDAVQALLNGDAYIKLGLSNFRSDYIRGQIGCLSGPDTLCFHDNRFRVTVTWDTGTDSGQATAVRETDDSGMFWFFRPSNLELLVKVLKSCQNGFGNYWVFSSATTNVGYEIRVTDTLENETVTYSNENGSTASPILDTAAFDTCP